MSAVQTPAPHTRRLDATWLQREFLCELSATMASLAVSLGEAAWRGDDLQSLVLTRQLRAVLIEALKLAKELRGDQ
jgi:hypothetical protein